YQGADGNHQIISVAFLQQFFQYVRNKTLIAIRAVIGGDEEPGSHLSEFFFQQYQPLVPATCDHIDLRVQLMQFLCLRVCYGSTKTPTYYCSSAHSFQMSRFAEGTCKIQQMISLFKHPKHRCGLPHFLEYDGDGALISVKIS